MHAIYRETRQTPGPDSVKDVANIAGVRRAREVLVDGLAGVLVELLEHLHRH